MDSVSGNHVAQRWFGSGHSTSEDADAAGSEAARAALAGRSASLLMIFCSINYDMSRLVNAVRKEAGDGTIIVGCSSMGQVVAPAATDNSVVVAALGGPGFQVSTRLARGAAARQRDAGAEAAGCLADVDSPNTILMLLNDGLTGEQHEVVRGAYGVVGGTVPLVGGCSADELTYSRTYQFHGDADSVEVLSDSVIGVAIGSDAPIGVGIAHGWRKQGDPMVVTKSEGGVVFELDHEPALDVFLRRIGADRSLAEDAVAFRAAAFSRPLGMSRRSGEDIRAVHAGDVDTGSLSCLADVPQGALTWLMETDADSLVDGAGTSCAEAVAGLSGAEPIGMLLFDCGGRKIMLGRDGLDREGQAITEVAGETPFAGFYTYGEVARTRGSRGMHHLTVVSLALA